MLNWILENKIGLLFYFVLILIIYLNRSKFEFQGKIIALYKTKLGLNFMDRMASKHKEAIRLLGYIGIGVGFIGMAFVVCYMAYTLYGLIFVPKETMGVTLVIPGLKIPNSMYFPLIYTILSIFIIAVTHELAHGIVARAWKIPVLSSGIVFLGPIIGAFVEPDETKLTKKMDIEQYSVLAAGPFSNIISAFVFFVLLLFIFNPVLATFYSGVIITDVSASSPAQYAGLIANSSLISIGQYKITNQNDLQAAIQNIRINDSIVFSVEENSEIVDKTVIVGEKDAGPYMGIMIGNKQKYTTGFPYAVFSVINWLKGLFVWLYALSLGIGLINLFPIGITDGGRMLQIAIQKLYGEKYEKIYVNITFLFVMLFIAIILLSYTKPLFA